jgi:hypothetical protein
MPSRKEIADQINLLAIHRSTLSIYLKQLALLDITYAPPGVFHGIHRCRNNIRRIKGILQAWNIRFEDHPDDSDTEEFIHLPDIYDKSEDRSFPIALTSRTFIDILSTDLVQDSRLKVLKSKQFAFDFLGIRETGISIDGFAVVDADDLSEQEISNFHNGFFSMLREWRPSFFLKRAYKKNGLICFIFEKGCTAEDILFILSQKRDSNPAIDSALTVSWVVDLSMKQVYTHDTLVSAFPPTMALKSLVYPGKTFLEDIINIRMGSLD